MKKTTDKKLPTTKKIIPESGIDSADEKHRSKSKGGLLPEHNAENDNDMKPKAEAERTAGSFAGELIFSVLLIVAVCALRTVHIYANNVGLVKFADLGISMWIYMGIGIFTFAILRIFLRKPYFASIFVAFGTFLAVNFDWLVGFFRLFIKTYNPAAVCGIAFYIVIVAGFFFLLRLLYKKEIPLHIIARILSITFTGLVLFNMVLAFIAMGNTATGDTQMAAVSNAAPVSTATSTPAPSVTNSTPVPVDDAFGLPNVYFFVLDEYGTFDMMSKYYSYDNDVLFQFLAMEAFNVSRESYATDNQTEHCFCDLLNLQYLSRDYSKQDCYDAIPDAELFQIFSDLGYSQYQTSNSDYFKGIENLNPDSEQGAYDDINMFGDESQEDVANGSISDAITELLEGQNSGSDTEVDNEALNEWGFYSSSYIRDTKEYQQYKNDEYMNYASALLSNFDYFEDPSNYGFTEPRVTYTYMLATHVPFIFNEYGGIISYNDNRNWEDTDIYLNQYKFITKHMIATISTIIANDPDSIIIIMSDHGIRYHADCNKKHTFYITDKDSCRIMNAVYIKGQQYNIEGLSGINTLRCILSLYEGLDYPPIEDPITSESPDCLIGIIPKPR